MRQRLDPDVRREQIMEAALKVFAEKGFAQASNREIAEAAGLNTPALIYHYFPSKLDLLRASIETFSPLSKLVEGSDWLMAQPAEVTLTRIGEMYLSMYENPETGRLLKVIFSEALHNREFADTFAEVGPLRILSLLKKYFGLLMEQGVLRRIDPLTAARSFIGPFVTLFIFRTVWGEHDAVAVDTTTLVADHVRIFLFGLEVKQL